MSYRTDCRTETSARLSPSRAASSETPEAILCLVARAIHAPSFLWELDFSRGPSLCCVSTTSPVLRPHPPPCQLLSLSFPYKRALLLPFPSGVLGLRRASEGFPSPVPVLPDHVVAHTPEASQTVLSLFSACDVDFAHKIGARPPLNSLRGYLCVHCVLRPGRLRCTLSGYVVESLSMKSFPTSCRLLATWLQSIATVGTWRQSALAPHPTRSGTVYLGAHFRSIILRTSEKLPAWILTK